MEKEFNRSIVREISKRIQEVLPEHCKGFDFKIGRGSFTSSKIKLTLEIRMKDSDGSVMVSENENMIADSEASRSKLKVSGHLIGSMWNIKDNVYTVVEYNTKRHKYPVLLKRMDGRLSKASLMFLSLGTQLTLPTLEEFTKWFTLDPDSDTILESDAEICDRVQSYLENNYPLEDGDKFFELVDSFNEKGLAKRWAKRAYELLFKEAPATMECAYLGLKVIYKEEMEESKSGGKGKSKLSAK